MNTNPFENTIALKETLIKRSTPDIYRSNALRYLGLPAFSTMRQIHKRKQIMEICKSTGASIPIGLGINLLHQKADYSIDLNQIIEKFKNPINHLVEEFFWFWPVNTQNIKQDQGLNFLSNNDPQKAMITWETQSLNGDPNGIALHNMTILKHIDLLEIYLDLLHGENSVSIDETKLQWNKCFEYWNKLLENEAFWSFLSSRVRDFDDPRLTTGNVRRLRNLIPLCLALIKIRLATRFSETNKSKSAKDVIELLCKQDFDKEFIDEACQLATEPLIKRINYLSASAEENIDTKKIKANLEINQVLDQGIKMFEVIEVIDKIRPINEYKDQFAEIISKIAFEYGYITQNDKETIALLEKIKSITQNIKIIDEIGYHIKDFKDRISKSNYWCAEGYHSLDASTYNFLEVARKNVNQKKYDKAQKILENLLSSTNNSSKNNETIIINTSLAYCLNMQAVENINDGFKLMDYVPDFVQKVANRVSYAEKEIGLAAWAKENNQLHQACYEGVLQCMACGKYIYNISNVYTFKWKELTYVGCYSCVQQYNSELQYRKLKITQHFQRALDILFRANKLNRKNKQIKENLDYIKSIAPSWGISIQKYMPSKPKPNQQIKQSVSKKTSTPYTSSTFIRKEISTPKPKTQQKSTSKESLWFWSSIAVIILIFLCIAIVSGY